MPETTCRDGLAGYPGSEADAEASSSSEIRGGARVLEVAQLLFGELHDLSYLEAPRLRDRVRSRTAALDAGGHPLVRFRRGRFELVVPPCASGELIGAQVTRAIPATTTGSVVPMPLEGQARFRSGALEVLVSWVRPARRLPREHLRLRPRWGAAAAVVVSFLAHQAALALVLAVPPSPSHVTFDDRFERLIVRWTPPERPREPLLRGPARARLGLLALGTTARAERSCAGNTPEPELHLGHLTVRGPRDRTRLRRALEGRLRSLTDCYAAALERCVGKGTIVLGLEIARHGTTTVALERSSFDEAEELRECVRTQAARWRFAPAYHLSAPTTVRVPIIFRYAGADPYVPDER
jgi:hypothetical protein